ncbi:SDR family NAD(P)-dependent oxidoreductase [Pleomorphovibrio marinus]|uniref:SDR family NAD(P)-dependent oxidoreductase n=1 Tax=Pleomorphovibrio marinus TaxID=2164132 RepID=UPI000E0B77BA|nr:SDR family NAD(P)-dependent oxidoreductase [Pleomorphovibrio marinus]
MTQRFENQVAVLTGAANGIGLGIAKRIAEDGGQLALWDINQKLLEERVTAMKDKGVKAKGYVVDVSDEGQVQAAFASVVQDFGKIDILAHAAGIVGPTQIKVADYPTQDFDQIYRVNLRGSFLVCKYALPYMESNGYGRIVLIASIAGKEGNPMMAGYSATKAGVIGLVKGIGKEYATANITVNGIAPAVIKTPMNEATGPEQLKYMTSKIPMNRLGTVEETASLAAWILSQEASFNTGFVFDLSGGRATY